VKKLREELRQSTSRILGTIFKSKSWRRRLELLKEQRLRRDSDRSKNCRQQKSTR